MPGQAGDVLDGDEYPVATGVIELKILRGRAVGRFEQSGAHVPAEPVGGVHDELAGQEGRGELCCQPI